MRFAALILAFLLSACGDDPPQVGGVCSSGADCDEGLHCDTSVAGGLCTKNCSAAGERAECPEGAVCDTLGTGTVCLKACKEDTECRPDQSCTGISRGSGKACHPKESVADAGVDAN